MLRRAIRIRTTPGREVMLSSACYPLRATGAAISMNLPGARWNLSRYNGEHSRSAHVCHDTLMMDLKT